MPTLTIKISPDYHELLERKAVREGTTIEAFLVQHVERLVSEGRFEESSMARDPIYGTRPVHESRVGDLSTQHDAYLYGTPRK